MYPEEVDDDAEEVEEGVDEGASGDAAPVFAEESVEGSAAGSGLVVVVVEVPLYGVARDDEVEGVSDELDAPHELDEVEHLQEGVLVDFLVDVGGGPGRVSF